MNRPTLPALLSAALFILTTLPCTPAQARAKRGAKHVAMQKFNASPREVSVVATAKGPGKGNPESAALVRVQTSDVAVCHLLILDGPAKAATKALHSVRLPVCAAYDKDARASRLVRIPLTTSRSAYRVSVYSKRMDSFAKGVETRRLWGLYASEGGRVQAVFERTSTSFASHEDKNINQSEECRAPTFAVEDEPSLLTISCEVQTMLNGLPDRTHSEFKYRWQGGRFQAR